MEKSTRGNVFCPTSKVHPAAKRAAIAAAAIAACIQASHAQMLEEVVVTSGKLEQQLFDAPASVSRVGGAEIRDSGPQVNLSDVLQRVPGVVALNRNNYAQDAQVSIRGFGARSAFGVRGLQILVDGIPQTTPDGQGQTNIATMSSVGSMEVMTGPLSQIYGNSSGGVIQVTTVAPPINMTTGKQKLRIGKNNFFMLKPDVSHVIISLSRYQRLKVIRIVIKIVRLNSRGMCFKRLKTKTVSIVSFGIIPLDAKRKM